MYDSSSGELTLKESGKTVLIYRGQLDEHQRPHGIGTESHLDSENIDEFTGLYEHGSKVSGKYTYKRGHTYEGQIKD